MMASPNMSSQPVMVQPLLDSLVPGFSLVSSLFSHYFHIDVSFYITGLLALAAIGAGLRYSVRAIRDSLSEYLICTAEIRMEDEVYNYVMVGLSVKQLYFK
jgi:chaperone BCS1